MIRVEKTIHSMYKLQKLIVAALLASFLFVTLHTFVHNSSDHTHDTNCGVYVLEQLYFGVDVSDVLTVVTLFIPFIFVLFTPTLYCVKVEKQFAIRAPPAP